MKQSLFFIGLLLVLSNCSQPESKKQKIITGKMYYPEENVTLIYEMNQDSILHGRARWIDSTEHIYLEEIYVNGKSTWKQFKEYHENGMFASVTEYVKDQEVSRKEYSEHGTLRFQCPLDIPKVGKLRYIINDGKRNYLLKNQEDSIEFFANNLPPRNQVIGGRNVHLSKKGSGWIIKPFNGSNKVTIYMECTPNCNRQTRVFIDSLIIPIK